ncbi:MAG: 2-oxoacid:acceptor oxidoreductase family protein, partial [Pseudomonadales bacterium]
MNRPVNIVVSALGGEGGGVLAGWITRLADSQGYITQSTSVPGVAQRTGATIYYIEIFPRSDADAVQQKPVMALFPTQGDVDIVIASEIVEAGRSIQRQFATPDKTTLITSSHRSYAISEKIALANGIANSAELIEVAKRSAKKFICFDMLEVARSNDSVISSVLFGALAGSAALPFSKESFEETIREGGIAVETNLRAFDASYEKAISSAAGGVEQFEPTRKKDSHQAFELPAGTNTQGR